MGCLKSGTVVISNAVSVLNADEETVIIKCVSKK